MEAPKFAQSSRVNITELDGDYTYDFFNNDWHADGKLVKSAKFATQSGDVKITGVASIF